MKNFHLKKDFLVIQNRKENFEKRIFFSVFEKDFWNLISWREKLPTPALDSGSMLLEHWFKTIKSLILLISTIEVQFGDPTSVK